MSTAVTPQRTSLVVKFAEKYSVDSNKLLDTLKATAFRQRGDQEVTNEQMMALLVVADQYGLNPFTKEIYAYNDKGAIVPVVSVDGWLRIINEHPQFDGMEFNYAEDWNTPARGRECYAWIECVIWRKDRTRPTKIREYLDETYQAPRGQNGGYDGPWQSHTKRMLRHKAIIQCGRVAFGFAGVHDDDEAKHIVERDMGPADVVRDVPQPQSKSAKAAASPAIEHADQHGVIDMSAMQRQAEPVQQKTAAAQPKPRARAAAQQAQQQELPTSREPGADDEEFEQGGTPPADPVPDSVLRILKTKMEQAALGEADMRKKFGHGYEGVTKANYQAIVDWTADPLGA
jgi:phage recombination protein Bet